MKHVLLILVVFLFYSCSSKNEPVYYSQGNSSTVTEKEYTTNVGNILKGNHNVINVERKGDVIYFMWLNNENEWINSKLDVTKVRYKYENITEPYIKFKWKIHNESYPIEEIMEEIVIYAVIVTNEQIK
jgi:hypothetical protein